MSDDDKIIPFPKPEPELSALNKFRELYGFRNYTLVNREPVRIDDLTDALMQRSETLRLTGIDPWRVGETEVRGALISTVFIGLDHRFGGSGPPILFETMIFGGTLDQFQNRCSTWEEAEAMHAEAVKLVRGGHLKVVK